MDVNRLASMISKPDVHRKVLRGYAGPYALGVTRLENNDDLGALRLRVESGNRDQFPSHIDLDGEPVPVLVDTNWTSPKPLKTTVSSE